MGKTETIEEAAERLVPNRILKTIFGSPYEITPSRERNSFIKGAKWQQEKMYTEEEVIKLLIELTNDLYSIYPLESLEKWFENFKK